MAGFLRGLHTAPTGGDLPASRARVRHSDWVALRPEIEATIYPLLQPYQVAWARALFDGALADPRNFDYEPRLINGDLAPYHIWSTSLGQQVWVLPSAEKMW